MTPTEQDKELREKLVETILSILGITDRSSGNRPGQIATLEQEIVSYITADRKRIKELGLEQAQEIYNSVQKEKVEKQKAVSENEKIREMLNDPEVIGKAAKGAIKAQRKMAGLESEEK